VSLQGQERIWNSLLARRLALEFVKVEGVLRFGHFVPGSFGRHYSPPDVTSGFCPRHMRNMEAPEPRGTERLAWATISSVPRPFGGPPPPLLAFLQPEPLPAALQTAREPKVRELTRLMVTDSVKLKDGPRTDAQVRPRSAHILRLELADANLKPRQTSALHREVVCLVRCDSTDTTDARSKPIWVKEEAIEPRPFGVGREFCTPLPRWSKKYAFGCKLFDQIAEEQERAKRQAAKRQAEASKSPAPPKEAHFFRKQRRDEPLDAEEVVPSYRRRRECPPSPRVRVASTAPLHRSAPQRMSFHIEVAATPLFEIPVDALRSPRTSRPSSASPRSSRPSSARADKSVTLPPKT
jgi:hypothetical protein